MRFVLIAYFIFNVVADPWIDALSADAPHSGSLVSVESHHSIERINQEQPADVIQGEHSHDHNNCPEDCQKHTCHLGHCGYLIGYKTLPLHVREKETFGEYLQSIPNAPVFRIKRPPKSDFLVA